MSLLPRITPHAARAGANSTSPLKTAAPADTNSEPVSQDFTAVLQSVQKPRPAKPETHTARKADPKRTEDTEESTVTGDAKETVEIAPEHPASDCSTAVDDETLVQEEPEKTPEDESTPDPSLIVQTVVVTIPAPGNQPTAVVPKAAPQPEQISAPIPTAKPAVQAAIPTTDPTANSEESDQPHEKTTGRRTETAPLPNINPPPKAEPIATKSVPTPITPETVMDQPPSAAPANLPQLLTPLLAKKDAHITSPHTAESTNTTAGAPNPADLPSPAIPTTPLADDPELSPILNLDGDTTQPASIPSAPHILASTDMPLKADHSAESAAPAQESPRPAAENTFDQIVLGLRGKIDAHNGKAEIRLDPPNLGTLHVSVNLENGSLTAQFQSASAVVRDLLKNNIEKLKSVLESQGVTVDKLAVDPPTEKGQANAGGPQLGSPNHDGRSAGQYQDQRSGQRNTRSPNDAFARLFNNVIDNQPIDLVA